MLCTDWRPLISIPTKCVKQKADDPSAEEKTASLKAKLADTAVAEPGEILYTATTGAIPRDLLLGMCTNCYALNVPHRFALTTIRVSQHMHSDASI